MNGGGGEIRLSIVGSGGRGIRKYPPVPPRVQMNARGGGGRGGSPVAAAIERRKQQVASASDENDDDDDANVDDDDDGDNHHRQQHHILVQKRQPSIVYKNFRDTFSCFSLGIFVWLSMLTLFIVYHLLYAAPAAASSLLARADALVPVIEAKKDHTRWDVPFTLVPDEGSLGRLMTLPLKQLVFDRLVRYDVCCFQQIYFSCRSATKNLGVECLIAKDRGALINVLHPDMVGARCVLMWSEKN